MLRQIFESFDVDKKGNIGVDMIGQILDMLGHQLAADELQVKLLADKIWTNVFHGILTSVIKIAVRSFYRFSNGGIKQTKND